MCVIAAKIIMKEVLIMFSVDGDGGGAHMSRYTINHSVKNGGRQGWGGGSVTVWQGDVS